MSTHNICFYGEMTIIIPRFSSNTLLICSTVYNTTVMILSFGRQVWANSADPDKSLIKVYTVFHCVCIFWKHYFMVKQPCSNFRKITANFWGVGTRRIFTVFLGSKSALCQE